MGTNVTKFNIYQDGPQCYFDILNAGNDGLRVGFNSGGVWFQAMNNGSPGNYIWSNH